MKTDATFGSNTEPHANNIVRINNKWYVIDVTNFEADFDPATGTGNLAPDGTPYGKLFARPVPENTIDLNNSRYSWSFDDFKSWDATTKTVKLLPWKYTTRSNMYWRRALPKAA